MRRSSTYNFAHNKVLLFTIIALVVSNLCIQNFGPQPRGLWLASAKQVFSDLRTGQVPVMESYNREKIDEHYTSTNKTISASSPMSSSSSFLKTLVKERNEKCRMKENRYTSQNVTYLAIARVASDTLHNVFDHHYHQCKLRDLEVAGARRVVVALRHPLARISSGVARRLEGHTLSQPFNRLFYDTFVHTSGADAYITALRDDQSPHHDAAIESTVGRWKQSYMLPIQEFYLEGSMGQAEVFFLCIDSLEQDFLRAHEHWGIKPRKEFPRKVNHVSKTSSKNLTNVAARYSAENIAWVEETYAADVALFNTHCKPNVGRI